MNKNQIFLSALSLLGLATLASCQDQGLEPTDPEAMSTRAMVIGGVAGQVVPGVMHIKVSEKSLEALQVQPSGVVPMSSVPAQMGVALQSIGAQRIERLFPISPRFEKRSKRAGLHLWFTVHMDENQPVGQAIQRMSYGPGVEIVEAVPVVARPQTVTTPMPMSANPKPASVAMPFNDPRLQRQWHYYNDGSLDGSVARADIDLFEAWKIETGKPNVIINIVDGGIDFEHEDLKESLWVNEAELNGQEGVDDDGNGYIDDVHGFNFVYDKIPELRGTVVAEDHGTHVAGTVAARNNNGIGLCGVAGGDGTPNSGVRIINSQIFTKSDNTANLQAAIVYGADNGAVISQNSWGYPYFMGPANLPASVKTAIDYFIENAGCDDDGNQLPNSPMKGGVLFFAAGNDNAEYNAWPAAYEKVVAVTAMGPNYKRATYSNRGDWADIVAPGGDPTVNELGQVASTAPGNQYVYMSGTSMACPHVSGVAGLVLSKYGGPGFTNTMLKEMVETAFRPVDVDEQNPDYAGKIGRGYISAVEAFRKKATIAPEMPTYLDADRDYTTLKLRWAAPFDGDDGAASSYKLYMSTSPLNMFNYESGKLLSVAPARDYISAVGKKAGETVEFLVRGLLTTTNYNFALIAFDRWGNASDVVNFSESTLANDAPVAKGVPTAPLRINKAMPGELTLKVSDPNGHTWTYSTSGDTRGVVAKRVGDDIQLTFRPAVAEGSYTYNVKLVDQYGAETDVEIPYEITNYVAPSIVSGFDPVVVGLDQRDFVVATAGKFAIDPNMTLKVNARVSNSAIATVGVNSRNEIVIIPLKEGTATIQVSASDGVTETETTSMSLRVVKNAAQPVYRVYPIPAVRDLNAVVNPEVTSATFVVMSLQNQEVLRRTVTPNASGVVTTDVSSLASGTYRLFIETNKGRHTQTIVKQ